MISMSIQFMQLMISEARFSEGRGKNKLALSASAQQTWTMIMFQSWIRSAFVSKTDLEQTFCVG